jgi:hypothetical protein
LSEKSIIPMPSEALLVKLRLANVLTPEIVCRLAAVLVNCTMLYVNPPPINVADALVSTIVDVPALNVRLVVVVAFIGPALPPRVIVELPNDIERTVVEETPNTLMDMLKLPVLKVPALALKLCDNVSAEPKVQPPVDEAKDIVFCERDTLLVVIVFPVVVAKKLITALAVALNATPVAAFVQDPYTLIIDVAADVIVAVPDAGPTMLTSSAAAFVPTVTA